MYMKKKYGELLLNIMAFIEKATNSVLLNFSLKKIDANI